MNQSELDGAPLRLQILAILQEAAKDCEWMSDFRLVALTGAYVGTVGARRRDISKPQFGGYNKAAPWLGGHTIKHRVRGGTWEYLYEWREPFDPGATAGEQLVMEAVA
jgi:hypothetical protein